MMQVPIFAILALALLKSTLAFDKRINFQSFKDCEQEFVNEGNGSKSWGSFYNIVPIDSLRNNEPNHDEILRTRMYYQGPRDLSVMLSDVNRDYQPGDAYFHTILGANCNSSSAVIYTDKDWHACTFVTDKFFEKLFHKIYYLPLDLVIKKEGKLEWHIPNGSGPILSCRDPRIARVRFIGFSSHNLNPNRYIVDCPLS